MIHLDVYEFSQWRKTAIGPMVDSIEIVKNDDTEVIVKLPLAPVISLLINASNLKGATTISIQTSVDGQTWYDFCIADRHKSANGSTIIDSLEPLKIEIKSDGTYTYVFDTTVKFAYLKLTQDSTDGNFNITMMVDSIW